MRNQKPWYPISRKLLYQFQIQCVATMCWFVETDFFCFLFFLLHDYYSRGRTLFTWFISVGLHWNFWSLSLAKLSTDLDESWFAVETYQCFNEALRCLILHYWPWKLTSNWWCHGEKSQTNRGEKKTEEKEMLDFHLMFISSIVLSFVYV